MSETCLCPRCRRRVPIPAQVADQTIACPGCGLAMTVPPDPGPGPLAELTARWPGMLLALAGGLSLLVVAGLVLYAAVPRDSAFGRPASGADDRLASPPDDEGPGARHGAIVPDKPPDPPRPREDASPKSPLLATVQSTMKELQQLDDEALRKDLLAVPEVALDCDAPGGGTLGLVTMAQRLEANGLGYPGPVLLAWERSDLAGLPLRVGLDGQLGKEPAGNLQALSRALRARLGAAIPKGNPDQRPDPAALRGELLAQERPDWLRPEVIPALLQLLQAEDKPVRLILVDVLARINDRRATEALAMRAMVDLSAEVRQAAVRALKDRPRDDYRELLLAGLRYPWRPVEAHAAEALAALGHKEAVPRLVKVLGERPGPLPFPSTDHQKEVLVVREVVRVNHLGNCVLCHAPSFDRGDLVRGAAPAPEQPLPAPVPTPQANEGGGRFVHADVTYLHQDFSVAQAVPSPGKWPASQPFDYLTRLRRLTDDEARRLEQATKDLPTARLREPVLFALRELTGKDAGTEPENWQALLASGEKPPGRVIHPLVTPRTGAHPAPQDWTQFLRLHGTPKSFAHQQQDVTRLADNLVGRSDLQLEVFLKQYLIRGDAAHAQAMVEAIPRLGGAARDKVRAALVEYMRRATTTDRREFLQDDSAEVRRAAAAGCGQAGAKGHIADLVALLEDPDADVAAAARTSLQALTGEDLGPAAHDWVAWWKKKSGS